MTEEERKRVTEEVEYSIKKIGPALMMLAKYDGKEEKPLKPGEWKKRMAKLIKGVKK